MRVSVGGGGGVGIAVWREAAPGPALWEVAACVCEVRMWIG